MHKTLDLLSLPQQLFQYGETLNFIMKEITALKEYAVKTADTPSNGDRYMTPDEAMKYLGMSPTTFDKYRYKVKPKIPVFRLDGSNRYKKSDLDRHMLLLNSRSQGLA